MIKSVIRLGLILVLGLIGYNYFYGTAEEKAQSQKIINTTKEAGGKVFQSIGGMLKSERKKFDEGKYDEAMGKVGTVFGGLKQKAQKEGSKFRDEIDELDKEKKAMEEEIAKVDKTDEKEKKRLGEKFGKLLDRLNDLSDKIDNSN